MILDVAIGAFHLQGRYGVTLETTRSAACEIPDFVLHIVRSAKESAICLLSVLLVALSPTLRARTCASALSSETWRSRAGSDFARQFLSFEIGEPSAVTKGRDSCGAISDDVTAVVTLSNQIQDIQSSSSRNSLVQQLLIYIYNILIFYYIYLIKYAGELGVFTFDDTVTGAPGLQNTEFVLACALWRHACALAAL